MNISRVLIKVPSEYYRIKHKKEDVMTGLYTKYMGLHLKSPVIVASSDFTRDAGHVKECQEHGAGAVVLKSIFQEEFIAKSLRMEMESSYPAYSEAYDYLENMVADQGQNEYLQLVSDASQAVSIPVIASINAVSSEGWLEYAKNVENAGAAALELNIAILPSSRKQTSEEIEKEYLNILKKVKKEVTIPVAMKIGPYFTSVYRIADKLDAAGADALVLFNRFYQFDIDVDKKEIQAGQMLSSSGEMSNTLRWVAMLSGNLDCSIAATTGIHTGEDVVKQLLAGADTVQMCSSFYKNGLKHIKAVNEYLLSWMERHSYGKVDEFRGSLSKSRSDYPAEYERIQFMKAIHENGKG